MKNNIVDKAKKFAKMKHKGQVRKFENQPYFIHPKRVAHILAQFKISTRLPELICVAYLHDSLEDTDTTYEELVKEFGTFIAGLVRELTSDKTGVEELGKADYLLQKMTKMSNYALVLKLADRMDNVNKIQWTNTAFKEKYIKETEYIVSELQKKRTLSRTHKKMIEEIEKHLDKNEARDNIDYLSFDSYYNRANKGEEENNGEIKV